MIATEAQWNVFLSFPLSEMESARVVRDSLSQAGFRVATAETAAALGGEIKKDLWMSLVESDAVVVLAPHSQPPSANSLVELGAAMAWDKPIFVLQEGVDAPAIPLKGFPRFNLARIDDLADAIHRSAAAKTRKEVLSAEQQGAIVDTYVEMGVPVDRIVGDVEALEGFTQNVNRRADRKLTSSQVAWHLLRLRKTGQLRRQRRA